MINVNEFSTLKSFVCATGNLKDQVAKITIDNRVIRDENVFVAIVGERYNPLDELSKLKNKIKYIVHENNLELSEKDLKDFVFIKVKNIVSFCQEAAHKIAVNFQRTNTLIAIAGSNGKTTTKEMLDHVLKENKLPYIATQKNNNNHLGVPLTLFQIREETKFAIVELGSNHPHEMEVLNTICEPNFGVVTNIGFTHMEFFPTLNDVFIEESNIFKHIEKSENKKIFFRNDDDEYLSKLEGDFCLSFGFKGKDYSFLFDQGVMTVTTLSNNHLSVIKNSYITGKHNFYNLAVVYVMCKNLTEISELDLLKTLESFKPTPNRGEWKEIAGKKIFLDAYNANPSSMLASIEGFIESVKKDSDLANVVIVIGDMNELGVNSSSLHTELAHKLKALGAKNVRFIGRYASEYQKGFQTGLAFQDAKRYREECFEKDLKEHNYFLIKGSRSLQLESILDIK